MWAFKTLWDKGLVYEGFRVLAYCWRCETPLSQHRDAHGRRLPRPPGPGAHRRRSQLDDRASRHARRGRRRRGRCRRNLALAVGPDIDYAVVEQRRRRATSSPRPRLGALRARARRAPTRRRARVKGSELVGRTYAPLFPSSPTRPNAFHVLAADFVDDRGRHRRRAHRARLRRGRPARRATPPASRWSCPIDEQGRFTAEVAAVGGHARVRRQPDDHPRPQGARRASSATRPTTTYPHCWRCDKPLIYRAIVVLVRAGDRVPGPHGRAQPADQLGARAHQGRQLRQVARRTPATGRSAATGSGARRSRCGSSDDPRYPRIDVYGIARRARARLRRAPDRPAPAVRRRARPARTPTTRPGSRRCAACPRCSTAGSSRARCRSRRCTTRSRTPSWFEHHYPGDFIVEYIGQTRGWFYTLHVLATALFDRPAFRNVRQPRHRARRRRPEDVEEPAQLPRPRRGVRHVRLRRACAGSCCRRRSCAAATSS